MSTEVKAAYWTPDELADRLGVQGQLVRKQCRSGKLPARRLGRLWLIPDRAIRERFPELYEDSTGPAA